MTLTRANMRVQRTWSFSSTTEESASRIGTEDVVSDRMPVAKKHAHDNNEGRAATCATETVMGVY